MNPVMTNEEFHTAWCSLNWNRQTDDTYWKRKRYEEEHHKLVGRQARVTVPDSTIWKRILTVVRANDDIIVFKLSNSSELIVSQRDIDNGCILEWI